MATTAENGLFPPMVDNYLPAQTVDTVLGPSTDVSKGFRIKFNPSPYNTLTDIKAIHVTIVGQSNYKSIFTSTYQMGIYVQDITVPNFSNQTIIIPTAVINQSEIRYNEYYKIQVRFCKTSFSTWSSGRQNPSYSDYLTDEDVLNNSSEWSTVCLGRIIASNNVYLKVNNMVIVGDTGIITPGQVDNSNVTLLGGYIKNNFDNTRPPGPGEEGRQPIYPANTLNNLDGSNDAEYLSSYRVRLYSDVDKTNLIFDSGNISTLSRSSLNEINYTIPYSFGENEVVYFSFDYQTVNLYNNSYDTSITSYYTHSSWTDQNVVSEITGLDTVIGKVSISFYPTEQTPPPNDPPVIPQGTKLYVRRSDESSNFTIWEDIWYKACTTDVSNDILFEDYTIESGSLYKYELSCILPGSNVKYTLIESYVISVFDHAFLTGEGTQLCVKFNPSISSYKRNVSDNIVTTIGGQYPYITRNGSMDYRTFALSGSIAYEMDLEHVFTSRSAIYGEWYDLYGTYFVNHYINQLNDRVTQRKFREMVINYLCSDVPKLFRSTPEGNILVRITDVSLTPNNQLGRMIYDFTCTATEIGDCSIANYKLYNIQDFGDLKEGS